jgi:hypothetical protein
MPRHRLNGNINVVLRETRQKRMAWTCLARDRKQPDSTVAGNAPRQCPRAVVVPAIHCRPANLARLYHTAVVATDSDPAIASH